MKITIDNRNPRLDSKGEIIDIHDGSLEYFEGRFYWYGTAYGETDGFGFDNFYQVYSSANLKDWVCHGNILPKCQPGVYYRPYVKYCPQTRLYVLWFNWYPTLWVGQYGVATSPTPEGSFSIVNENVPVRYKCPGDLGLFVDTDGTGYLIYTSIEEKHGISIERLAPDFCSSTMEGSDFLSHGDEACTLFRRGDLYYALFDRCCCFGPQGSGAKVHTASHPFGSWEFRGNINQRGKAPCADMPVIYAQQAHVAVFPSTKGSLYIWTGDRWGSRPDGIKGHDFQYWSSPLEFAPDGSIAPLKWVSEWSFDL